MNILALDTSTEACSAALLTDNGINERFEIAPRGHAMLILPMLEQLLREAGLTLRQIDAVAFGRGPGAFTGVRIAASVAQGVAFGAELPVIAVSSLAALAQGALRERGMRRVAAAIDARMGEVYFAAYQSNLEHLMELRGDEGIYPPRQAPLLEGEGWFAAGSGWLAHGAALREHLAGHIGAVDAARYPHAQDVARLAATQLKQGLVVDAEQALPVYLRNEVTWKKSM
ncbi:MAG: tRNA (adenosine(37)-N6)-threonylcarbamoyltransferase complex dimerization subunit type 1 TsaB [Pseudomonadota bacterium]